MMEQTDIEDEKFNEAEGRYKRRIAEALQQIRYGPFDRLETINEIYKRIYDELRHDYSSDILDDLFGHKFCEGIRTCF